MNASCDPNSQIYNANKNICYCKVGYVFNS